ncbi:hypothetical protein [Amycolatopsis minnesotensis]|uniref:Secreted protein n=1 Tax=Amycolatopsis minnesotensis TaxID=337894 RepID=A0ABP5CFS0_9PSEU
MFAKFFIHVATLITVLRTRVEVEHVVMAVAYGVSASTGHAELLVAIAYGVVTTVHVRATGQDLRHTA